MIQPNELRLGNYVLGESSYGDLLIQINGITSTSIHGVASISGLSVSGMTADEVKPIPLTEEILLKCGFESVEGDGERYNPDDECKNIFEYRLDVGIFYRDLICRPALGWYVFIQNADLERKWDLRSKDIYFLHELQNLYFAITGKELEVKL